MRLCLGPCYVCCICVEFPASTKWSSRWLIRVSSILLASSCSSLPYIRHMPLFARLKSTSARCTLRVCPVSPLEGQWQKSCLSLSLCWIPYWRPLSEISPPHSQVTCLSLGFFILGRFFPRGTRWLPVASGSPFTNLATLTERVSLLHWGHKKTWPDLIGWARHDSTATAFFGDRVLLSNPVWPSALGHCVASNSWKSLYILIAGLCFSFSGLELSPGSYEYALPLCYTSSLTTNSKFWSKEAGSVLQLALRMRRGRFWKETEALKVEMPDGKVKLTMRSETERYVNLFSDSVSHGQQLLYWPSRTTRT